MTAAPDIAIEVEGLTKSFDGRKVVRNLSMRVKRGEIYGFLGPNGSGKTTTIRMLCGLLTPDEGRGTCLGYDIRTEIVGSKGTIMLGYLQQTPELVLTAAGTRTDVVDHFLVRFADGYLDEMRDFVRTMLSDREPQVDGFDGRQAVAAAAAAERSYREGRSVTLQNPTRSART